MSKIKKYANSKDEKLDKVTKEFALNARKKFLKKEWKLKYKEKVIAELPKRFAENFDSYDFSKIKKQKITSVFIHGKVGGGKSVLSTFLYVAFVKQLYLKIGNYRAISHHFVIFPKFVSEVQKDFDSDLVQKYAECDILVLDEFGGKKVTEYVYDLVYMIINERYLNLKPTIINSNRNLTELLSVFDDRVVRRIDEDFELIEKKHFNKQ